MLHGNEPEICVDLDSRRNLLVFCTKFNLSETQMVTNRNEKSKMDDNKHHPAPMC